METNQKVELTTQDSRDDVLRRIQTAESVFLPRDVFEKLYLSPEKPVAGDLRKQFGNPTPVALIGFLMAATPNACVAMGWRGSGGGGGALLTVFIFFGGFLQILGGIGEWILGNTFPMCLFFTYGTFWIVQGTNLQPFFAIGTNYSPTGNNLEGQTTPMFFASIGFYYCFLAVITSIYCVCALRTNVLFFSALLLLVIAFASFAGVYWNLAVGEAALAAKLQICGGAFTFALCLIIWYLFLIQMLDSVDFPLNLPVGDLSTHFPSRSSRAIKKTRTHED